MTVSTIAAIIAACYGGLLLLWLLTLPLARRAFGKQPAIVASKPEPHHPSQSSPATAIGALAVFLANIVTVGLFLLAGVRPELRDFLETVRTPLSAEVQIAGAALFFLNGLWGLLALIFNPAYTPLFLRRKGQIPLATRGPYAIIRHPRYGSEAALNVILFLFIGAWIPLLGIFGWAAIRRQAIREEEFLLRAAPESYERYMAVTGRFLPRWKFRKDDRRGA